MGKRRTDQSGLGIAKTYLKTVIGNCVVSIISAKAIEASLNLLESRVTTIENGREQGFHYPEIATKLF